MTKKVLVIDADTQFQSVAQQVFNVDNVELTLTSSAGEGLAAFSQVKPNLVILCTELTDMSGFMAHKKIREHHLGPWAKIMITSSKLSQANFKKHQQMLGSLAAEIYLRKP